jgi:hypothetical protein
MLSHNLKNNEKAFQLAILDIISFFKSPKINSFYNKKSRDIKNEKTVTIESFLF